MKKCSVYFRGGEIFVLASATDVFGIGRNIEPFFRLSQPVSPQELGRVVLDAIAAYRDKIPGKTYVRGVKEPPHPFLSFAGIKSWKAFERGARYFLVSDTGNEIEITPSVPAEKGGYLHQTDKTRRCHAQPEEIGSALLQDVS